MRSIVSAILLLFAMNTSAQELNKKVQDQYRNQEVLLNTCTREGLTTFPEFKASYDSYYAAYKPDSTVLDELSKLVKGKKITIVLGSWCGDSKFQVPNFLKLADALNLSEKDITFIAVDGAKKAENGLIDKLKIERVPTFIFTDKKGIEVGRITERPQVTLEKDMLIALVAKPALPGKPEKNSNNMPAALESDWLKHLGQEFEMPYMKTLKSFLLEEKQKGFTVYPKGSDIFNAFNHTPFEQVKVVILGQDPYHGTGQAHGLSFSVQKGMIVPPSLKNMYKELAEEFPNFKTPNHGNLTAWADQGVLLLNATLTVRAHEAGSHQKRGWEIFTDKVITELSEQRSGLVFLLWGRYAQQKEGLIDHQKHHILKAAHPSPFSAYNGFFGSGHFKKTNELLTKHGLAPINWQIED